jgi:hypothetical protein
MNSDKFFFEKIFDIKYNKEVDENIYYDEKCISKCYPKNTLFYDMMDGDPLIFDKEKCSILSKTKEGDKTKDCKSNNFTENIDENDNLLSILINNSYSYLNNIYNLKTYDDILNFLEMNIKELPLLTQKRILNCIYCAYINYAEFPNKKYIFIVKNILINIFNIKVHSKKIYNKIIKLKNNNKYKENNDIFQYLYSKFYKKE